VGAGYLETLILSLPKSLPVDFTIQNTGGANVTVTSGGAKRELGQDTTSLITDETGTATFLINERVTQFLSTGLVYVSIGVPGASTRSANASVGSLTLAYPQTASHSDRARPFLGWVVNLYV